jgi:hypothetical protein
VDAHQSHNSLIHQVFVLLAQPLAIDVLAHHHFVLLAIIRKIGYLMVMLVFVMLLVGSIMIWRARFVRVVIIAALLVGDWLAVAAQLAMGFLIGIDWITLVHV